VSYNEELVTKLSHTMPQATCCRLALLSAIVKIDGSIHLSGQQLQLELKIRNMALARYVATEFKSLFGLAGKITLQEIKLDAHKQGHLIIAKDYRLRKALENLDILNNNRLNFGLPKSLLKRNCCKHYFARGAFLAGGYIAESSKSAHLEITSENQGLITELSKMLNQQKLHSKTRNRKTYSSLYLKEREGITSFLKFIEAPKESLEFENTSVIREIRNSANRVVNAETANANKVIKNAFRQIKEITDIENEIGLTNLPRALREICSARLKYPEASLATLGRMMEPVLAKSAVNHRFRRIREIAGGLKQGPSIS